MGQVFNTVYPIKTRVRATMPLELLTRLTSGKWDSIIPRRVKPDSVGSRKFSSGGTSTWQCIMKDKQTETSKRRAADPHPITVFLTLSPDRCISNVLESREKCLGTLWSRFVISAAKYTTGELAKKPTRQGDQSF